MRRALTFLLIFTYQIMSVVFYLIFPRSTFYRSSYALLVDVAMVFLVKLFCACLSFVLGELTGILNEIFERILKKIFIIFFK